jgi:hypothetical protein
MMVDFMFQLIVSVCDALHGFGWFLNRFVTPGCYFVMLQG